MADVLLAPAKSLDTSAALREVVRDGAALLFALVIYSMHWVYCISAIYLGNVPNGGRSSESHS
jgi:hypothetical protein